MSKKVILIVDDDDSLQEVLAIFLRELGYITVAANSAGKFFDVLHSMTPDLLILDYWIGSSNGVNLANWFRGEACYDQIPIMFISAECELPQKAKKIKNCQIIAKPFNIDTLLGAVKKCLGENL